MTHKITAYCVGILENIHTIKVALRSAKGRLKSSLPGDFVMWSFVVEEGCQHSLTLYSVSQKNPP